MTVAATTETGARPVRAGRRPPLAWAGTVPFLGYAGVFLLLPTGIVIWNAFRRPTGGFTLSNLSALSSITNPVTKALGATSSPASLIDVGNISANDTVALAADSITATSTTQVGAINVAGLIDIAGLTSTASATSDGVTGTPKAILKLGQVTVDGQSAYIDGKGVHVATTDSSSVGITPAQLQRSVDATLAQDGISIRVVDPQLTTTGPAATADAGGLVIAIAHQIDVPFIPGEPTIPVPGLGNVGLPAGLYTATTSITVGLAHANVAASGPCPFMQLCSEDPPGTKPVLLAS